MDDKPLGFFFVKKLESGTLAYICRFMVDQCWQGQGVGRRMMRQLLHTLFSAPLVETVDLAVSKNVGGAVDFCRKCGFAATGEPYPGGWRMVLSRTDFHTQTQVEQPDAGNQRKAIVSETISSPAGAILDVRPSVRTK